MDVFAIVAGGVTSLIVTVIGFITANKLGVGTSQLQLVSTLKDLVSAQSTRIEQLEEEGKDKDERIASLESKVEELEKIVVQLNIKLARQDIIQSRLVAE